MGITPARSLPITYEGVAVGGTFDAATGTWCRLPHFADTQPGPKGPRKATGTVRQKVLALRADGHSVTEISAALTGPLVDAYRRAGEKAGHPGALKVAISTHFHAAADPSRARAVYPYYYEYLRPKRPGGRGFVVSQAAFDAGTNRQGAIMIGSAGEITDKLLEAVKTLRLDRIFAQVDWGGLVEESVARYATEIAPALRAA